MPRLRACTAASSLIALFAPPIAAQTPAYRDKPIKVVVPFAMGRGQDAVGPSSPEQLRAFVASELKKWAGVVELANIKPE